MRDIAVDKKQTCKFQVHMSMYILLLSWTWSGAGQGQENPLLNRPALEAFSTEFFGHQMESKHVPGAVFVVVKGDQILFEKGYGYANLDDKTSVNPEETLFRLGSVSKLITATAAMQLVEEGHIDLHTDINTYLKGLKVPAYKKQPVTMAHLLTHSGGFDSRTIGTLSRSEEEMPSLSDYLAGNLPARVRQPGTVISYCNYGIALVGLIVETVSGVTFGQTVQEQIFKPLEMNQSSFGITPDVEGELATGYWFQDPDSYHPVGIEYISIAPAGLGIATAKDMANFMIAHLQQGRFKETRILQETTIQEMHQRQFAHHDALPGWCYGFNEDTINGIHVIGHAGAIAGIWSYLLLLPSEQAGFFFAQTGGGAFMVPDIINAFMDRFFPHGGEGPSVTTESLTVTPLEQLQGRYRFSIHPHTTLDKVKILIGVPEIEVRIDQHNLLTVRNFRTGHIQIPEGPYREISPLLFEEIDGIVRIGFRHNTQGQVTHLMHDGHWDAVSYEKIGWHEHRSFNRTLMAFCVLVFVSVCIAWPASALQGKIRNRPVEEKLNPQARLARLCAGITCCLAFFMIVTLIVYMSLFPPTLQYGELGFIPVLLILPFITSVLSLGLIYFTIVCWKYGYWTVLGRLHYTLVTMAALVLIPFLWHWNLLGFYY